MSEWSTNSQEAKHISDTVMKAVICSFKESHVIMQDGNVIKGKVIGMGMQNTSGSEPVRGHITYETADGTVIELDALDVKHIQ